MKKKQIVFLAQLALLSAIVWLMAFTPIGYLKTAGLEITFILIPVIVGAIVLGPAAGAILGLQFGITSFIQCFGLSPFGAALLAINPAYTLVVCIVPRVLVGFLVAVIFRALQKIDRTKLVSFSVASLSGALLNTILFMGLVIAFFWNTDYLISVQQTLGATNVFWFVILFVGVNGLIEAAACFVIGTAVAKALHVAQARMK